MPVTKSAKKKLRQDKKRTIKNKGVENLFKITVKKAIKSPTPENIRKATKIIDKTAKLNIIHKNKAARIKSRLSKLIAKKPKVQKTTVVKKATKASKTKAKK